MLLQLADDKAWLITDLGGWTDKRGKIWLMTVEDPANVHLREVLGGLTLPHTIAYGPDGNIYVAEMNRIFRLDVKAWTATSVVDGLPGNRLHIGRHPLSHFTFDGNGDMLVNVGADTDQCADANGAPLGATCTETDGDSARGNSSLRLFWERPLESDPIHRRSRTAQFSRLATAFIRDADSGREQL
jgi:hypothetical protein